MSTNAPIPLRDLDPQWVGHGGEGITYQGRPVPRRERIALAFLCPCAVCEARRAERPADAIYTQHMIYILNPEDGGPPVGAPAWYRMGTTFETLVLTPSILSDRHKGGCGWHGFVGGVNGALPGMVETI